MQASIKGEKISFSYDEKSFIESLDIEIAEGKITTIIGPNGSGKSTVLNLLANQYKASGGQIYLKGKKLSEIKQKELAKELAVVYQHNSTPGDVTVEQLVHYGRTPYKKFWEIGNDEDEKIVDWALEVTELTSYKKRNVSELSGGERQRAWIAMSLAQKPDILFLDEPTTYLDIYHQLELLELVDSLNKEYGLTVVMVLHDMNQAIQYSDHVVVMKKGQIRYNGETKEVFSEEMIKEIYGIKTVMRWCEINKCHYVLPITLNQAMCSGDKCNNECRVEQVG